MQPTGWRITFYALFATIVLAQLVLGAALPPFVDEAFYRLESRHPAPGYDDVPLATPWLIALGETLFGHGTTAMRLPFLACWLASLWLVLRIARRLGGDIDGAVWLAGCAALALPLFAATGVFALPDAPLTLAILLCAYALLGLSTKPASRGDAALLALGIALGWWSHYRFAPALAAGALWLIASAHGRAVLRQRATLVAIVAGSLAGLAPLLWHNARSRWTGFRFQFDERHDFGFHAAALLDVLWQALAATPLLYALLIAALVHVARHARTDRAASLVAWCGGALIVGYLLLAPFVDDERTRVHWSLPALLLLAAASPRVAKQVPRFAALAISFGFAGTLALLAYLGVAAWAPDRLAAYKLYPDNFVGFEPAVELARDALAAAGPGAALAADHALLAAQLAFAFGNEGDVHALDHPLNTKHGRARQLAQWSLDEAALRAAMPAPMVLIVETGATPLRSRAAAMRAICARWPGLRRFDERVADHGRKRYVAYVANGDATHGNACTPPAIAYVDTPASGDVVDRTFHVSGWALRDGVGIESVRVLVDGERVAQLDVDVAMPGVRAFWPDSTDPRHPHVGFAGDVTVDVAPGPHWLTIETIAHDGAVERPVSVRVDMR